jgi:hypothetical protein
MTQLFADRFDWEFAIERNRMDLPRVVAALFASVGLATVRGVPKTVTLPRRPCRRLIAHGRLTCPVRRSAWRWRAKIRQPSPEPRQCWPVRPGYPPGRRKRHIHDVDEVLDECHTLAMWIERNPVKQPSSPGQTRGPV